MLVKDDEVWSSGGYPVRCGKMKVDDDGDEIFECPFANRSG
jgi:hypothetical protein